MSLIWNKKETIYSMWRVTSGGTATEVYGQNTGGSDLFPDNFTTGYYLSFNKNYAINSGYDYRQGAHKFQGLEFDIDVPLSAVGYSYIWQYYDQTGSTASAGLWKDLTNVIDNTSGLTVSGVCSVTWDIPTTFQIPYKLYNNSYHSTGMFVRLYVSGITTSYEGGHQRSSNDIKDYSYGIWINDGNTYTPLDIYNFCSTNNINIVTKSDDDKNILLNSNLMITNGKLHIYDHTVFTVGKKPSIKKEWYSIEIGSNGILQMGYKDSQNRGYKGGDLIWNNGWKYTPYLTWYGEVYSYSSRFWMYGYGYAGLTSSSIHEIIDSIWTRGYAQDRFYFSASSKGKAIRTSIQQYYLYVYSGNWSFDTISLPAGESSSPYGILAGAASHTVKINNTDFGNQLISNVTQRACIALIDCKNIPNNKIATTGNYDTAEYVTRRYSLDILVIDDESNSINNAILYIKDKDNIDALRQDLYERDGSYLQSFSSSATTTGSLYYPSDLLEINDMIYVRGEIVKLISMTQFTNYVNVTLERNQTGSLSAAKIYYQDVYKIIPYDYTNSDGKLTYSGKTEYIKYNLFEFSKYRLNNIEHEYSHTPFNMVIKKYGKLNSYSTLSPTAPISLTIKLSEDIFITETDKNIVSGYTGIILSTGKTITINSSLSINKIYDYSHYWETEPDYLTNNDILTTIDGIIYKINSDWKLILNNSLSGKTNIVGTVQMDDIINIDEFNIDGKLILNTGGTFEFKNSKITELVNNTSNNVTINGYSFHYTTNTGPNITINELYLLKLTGLKPNTEIRVYKKSDGSEIMGIESVSSNTFEQYYNYISDIDVFIAIHHIEYVYIEMNITLSNKDIILPIQQRYDLNYKN